MANFGIDVTQMSEPDIRGAKFTSQGIQDRSEAMSVETDTNLLTNLGKLGIDAYHGEALAEAEQADKRVVAEAETGLLAKSIFKSNIAEAELDPVLKAYGMSTKKYISALQQGVMSPVEFEMRTLANLRTAVARNPGMREELTQHTKAALELTGMSAALKQEAEFQKLEETKADKYEEQLDAGLSKENIFLPRGTPIYVKEQTLMDATQDTKAFEVWKRANEHADKFTAEQAIAWADVNGFNAVRGAMSGWTNSILALGVDVEGNPQDFAAMQAEISAKANLQKEMFVDSIPSSIRNNPVVQEKIEAFNKAIDDSVVAFNTQGSGEAAKKAAMNHLELTKTFQQQAVHDRFDVATIELGIKIAASDPNKLYLSEKFRDNVVKIGMELLSGGWSSPIVEKNMPKDRKDTNISRHVENAAILGLQDKNYEGLRRILDSLNKKTPSIKDPTQKYIYLANNLEAVSKSDLTGAGTDVVTQVETMINNFLGDPKYGVPSLVANLEASPTTTMEILPDGKFAFTGTNADKFNRSFGISLNLALTAYAKALNMSVKSVSDQFQMKYIGISEKEEEKASQKAP